MPEQQFEIPDLLASLGIEDFCLDETAKLIGYDNYDDYLDNLPTIEKRTGFWEEYYQLMDEKTREFERMIDEEKRDFERSINMITIPISEGLCQSNNLNHLFTVT